MEPIKPRIALYPGCSLEGSSGSFEASLNAVFRVLGVETHALKDWTCCGATSAHAVDRRLHLGLNLRNLALAEKQGFAEVVAPCAACYHRLASTNHVLRGDPELLGTLNTETGFAYRGGVEVRNLLDLLVNVFGVARIAEKVTVSLDRLKAVCYYGCLNTRIPRMKMFDAVEYPMSMDHIAHSLGVKTLDWSYKTECCGASLFVTSEAASSRLIARILADAAAHDADCILVACPMCQNNLDVRQETIRRQHHIPRPLPVLFISQVMGLAFGVSPADLQLDRHFVPFPMELVSPPAVSPVKGCK